MKIEFMLRALLQVVLQLQAQPPESLRLRL